MKNEMYENSSSPSIKRIFVKISCAGPISHGIGIWRKVGEVDWHTDFQASYYTGDLRAAREGTSPFMKYLGKVNLESKIAECLFEFAGHLKFGAKLEELSHNQTNTVPEK
jgi:hypothetical protein